MLRDNKPLNSKSLFLILLLVISVTSLVLSCISISKTGLTSNQENTLANIGISSNGCLSSKCFTNNDVTTQNLNPHVANQVNYFDIVETYQIQTNANDLVVKSNQVNFEKTPILLANLTTIEKYALLDIKEGTIVFDNDQQSLNVYQNNNWSSLIGNGGVSNVTGKANQIDSSGGVSPEISISDYLLPSIENWRSLYPLTDPSNNQFLQYQSDSKHLEWVYLSSPDFPISRTLHVEKYGNDTTGNGSTLTPFLTLKRALEVAQTSTSVINQTCILVGTGNFVEANPLVITSAGLTIAGTTQRGSLIASSNASQPLLTSTVNTLISNIRIQGTIRITGNFNVLIESCFFSSCPLNAIELVGNGIYSSVAFVNNCTFSLNTLAISSQSTNLLVFSCLFGGTNVGSDPSALLNGIHFSASNGVGFVYSCFFIRFGYCIKSENSAHLFVSDCNFTNSIKGIESLTQSTLTLNSVTCSNMFDTQIGFIIDGPGTVMKMSNCVVDGSNTSNAIGYQVTNDAVITMNSCTSSFCHVGIRLNGTASTKVICPSHIFASNIISVHLQGTATFIGVFIVIDDTTTLVFDSTTNVQLSLSTLESSCLKIGDFSNTSITNLLQVASKTTDESLLLYNPNFLGYESLAYVNPAQVNSGSCNISQLDSAYRVITNSLSNNAKISLFTNNVDGIRGWDIVKLPTSGILEYQYTNSIAGQLGSTNEPIIQLDGTNNNLNLLTSTLTWSQGSTIYESGVNTLNIKNLILSNLSPNQAVVSNGTSNLVSSIVSATELSYLTNCTSNVQLQLNGKLSTSGGSLSGNLVIGTNGTVLNPALNLNNNSGIYSSQSNYFNLETNDTDRLQIDDTGNLSLFMFTTKGILHNNAQGLISSSLIINEDITNSTIGNEKLASASSGSNANYIVVRDANQVFSTAQITITGNVVNNTDVATKSYVDTAVTTGFVIHENVLVSANFNVTLTGLQTINTVSLIANDRILLIGQSNAIQNGCWLVQVGAWTRPLDFADGTLARSSYFYSQQNNSGYVCSTPSATIGTHPLAFSLFSSPASISGANLGSGTGHLYLNTTGNVLNFATLLADTYLNIIDTVANEVKIGVQAGSALSVSNLVARDVNGDFAARFITANLIGSASGNLSLSGGTLTNFLELPAGSVSFPTLRLGSVATGLASSSGTFQIITNGQLNLSINTAGVVTIPKFITTGIVHNSNLGVLTTSLIVNADITIGTIQTDRLSNVSSTNTNNNIVVRNGSGDFAANIITANLVGTVTGNVNGHASLDLPLTGGTLTGPLFVGNGSLSAPLISVGTTNTGFSYSGSNFQISVGALLGLSIATSGVVRIPNFTVDGVVKSNSSGILTCAKILDSDITIGTIGNDKLQTLVNLGLVQNSATSATPANERNTIVLRNDLGEFTTQNIIEVAPTSICIGQVDEFRLKITPDPTFVGPDFETFQQVANPHEDFKFDVNSGRIFYLGEESRWLQVQVQLSFLQHRETGILTCWLQKNDLDKPSIVRRVVTTTDASIDQYILIEVTQQFLFASNDSVQLAATYTGPDVNCFFQCCSYNISSL
jgi:hypothetical protein